MGDETEMLGRIAIWRAHRDHGAVQLEIDLDHHRAVTLTIDRAGHATAALPNEVAKWLEGEASHAG